MLGGKFTPIDSDFYVVFKQILVPHPGVLAKLKEFFLLGENSGRRYTMNDPIGNGHICGDEL